MLNDIDDITNAIIHATAVDISFDFTNNVNDEFKYLHYI